MRILVLGAGGTGAYFGARLIQAGHSVSFLVRPARAALLRRDGLRVNSAKGPFAAPVDIVTDVPPGGVFDLVILSCKAYDLDAAIAAVAPAIGPATRILPLLNGLRHLDVLDLAFGRERVWGGVCHISVALQDDGSVTHLGQLERLTFGSRQPDARIDALAPALLPVPADVRHSGNILDVMWEKFVFLATLAGMTCLMRASVGQIVATPDGEALMRRCYRECREVAARLGHPVAEAAVAEGEAILTTAGSPLKASMLRDLDRGGRTECEHILGDLLARAHRVGLELPLLAAACTRLRIGEAGSLAAAAA
ncbi:ketopantoate reductase family protein [Tahibacter amnicola]|uniref:2-dehydropantoate 2-reductase n=1 Tax=Tahibacter amnicola TaxID=2976241 RepID=A0ABY6BIR7_9GAMM|nr:ketopantoate reductase family protein [Tahibacter amnicola]UXI69654.1 ketopantoate reductase family protein [Tahibacter amnicola]